MFAAKAPRMNGTFDLVELVDDLVGGKLLAGDIIVVSSKFVAISEGRIVALRTVRPGPLAKALSGKLGVSPQMCELVVRESDEILGGVPGFILATKEGLLTPNAGIDKSNIDHGKVVLYPRRPLESASLLRDAIKFRRGIDVGVVISDSRLMPTRKGTVGVALAAAGLEGIRDLRGNSDLFGNILRVTSQALADDLTSAAQLLMGESDEATPLVVIRGMGRQLVNGKLYDMRDFAINSEQCVYLRSLGYSTRRKTRRSF
ncbi:MAG: coenzyme F420-0:L-glutamate ligase [Thaumarchaeota archaeon]|nr:coenzyme F420-0:L-glutamate ligase [Nitrososphaerota archaeon]